MGHNCDSLTLARSLPLAPVRVIEQTVRFVNDGEAHRRRNGSTVRMGDGVGLLRPLVLRAAPGMGTERVSYSELRAAVDRVLSVRPEPSQRNRSAPSRQRTAEAEAPQSISENRPCSLAGRYARRVDSRAVSASSRLWATRSPRSVARCTAGNLPRRCGTWEGCEQALRRSRRFPGRFHKMLCPATLNPIDFVSSLCRCAWRRPHTAPGTIRCPRCLIRVTESAG